MTTFLKTLCTALFGLVLLGAHNAHSNQAKDELIPLEYFVKHSEFSNLVISPTGQYMAASSLKADGTEMVAVFDIQKMQMTARIDFVQNQKPSTLTWLNDERIGIRIARQLNFLDAPVLTETPRI